MLRAERGNLLTQLGSHSNQPARRCCKNGLHKKTTKSVHCYTKKNRWRNKLVLSVPGCYFAGSGCINRLTTDHDVQGHPTFPKVINAPRLNLDFTHLSSQPISLGPGCINKALELQHHRGFGHGNSVHKMTHEPVLVCSQILAKFTQKLSTPLAGGTFLGAKPMALKWM